MIFPLLTGMILRDAYPTVTPLPSATSASVEIGKVFEDTQVKDKYGIGFFMSYRSFSFTDWEAFW